MNKTYIAPALSIVCLTTEGMMATSLVIGGKSSSSGEEEKVTQETEVLSNQRGWDCSNWVGEE